MEQADIVIIGSGQGGVPLARTWAQEGKKVVLFERERWGGTCVNYGCIPSKAFLAAAHAAAAARNAGRLGIHADVAVDFPAVMARVRRQITSGSDGVAESLADAGVTRVHAAARFVGPHRVAGGDVTVTAPTIVINSGKSPHVPDIPGLDGTPFCTYKDVWWLEAQPARLIVIGGGYTGVEMGQGFQRLGTQTTILERSGRLVGDEEVAVSEALQQALAEDGACVLCDVATQRVAYDGGLFTVTLDDGRTVEAEALLLATGRKPNVAALNLEAAGIATGDKGHIRVDDHFRTTADGVYAIGDVTGQPAFTHVSWEDYRRLHAILSGDGRTQGDRVLGYAFFTEPQVGRVGRTLQEAREQGYDARAATIPLAHVGRASLTGHDNGFYRMVVDNEDGRILGATLVGPAAAELVHVFLALMEAGASWQLLEQSTFIHPTYAEDLPTLARRLKDD